MCYLSAKQNKGKNKVADMGYTKQKFNKKQKNGRLVGIRYVKGVYCTADARWVYSTASLRVEVQNGYQLTVDLKFGLSTSGRP
eukprot:628718-Pyramimonas_sp.AAC.1